MKLIRLTQLVSTAALLLGAGCSGDSEASNVDDKAGPKKVEVGKINAGLTQADSCSALLSHIQTEALLSLETYAEQLRDGGQYYYGGPGVAVGGGVAEGDVVSNGAGPAAGAPVPPPVAAPPQAGAPSVVTPGANDPATMNPVKGGGEQGPGGRDFSETNTQVKGVDEADIVKTDGNNLYLVHGTELFILDVSATDATVLKSQTALEGQPHEMFVVGDQAVVFSHVNPTPELVGGEKQLEALYRFSDPSHSKMTVLDLSGKAPKVVREVYTQGSYVSSRRVDDIVRSVVRGPYRSFNFNAPGIEFYDIFGDKYDQEVIDEQVDSWLERKQEEIESTNLDFWLPTQREKEGENFVTLARNCESHYVPSPGLTEPGATSIVSLDLSDVDGALGGATILGGADQIYSNAETLVLAHHDYRFGTEEDARQQTALHHFKLDGNKTSYTTSGFIPGQIINQFSMDEHKGVFRVATTEDKVSKRSNPDFPEDIWFESTPENRVYLLEAAGDEYAIIGKTAKLGHEGERIFATRFIGEQGYVVTFRQTDPLVVLDLSNPKLPTVAGELEIPGFSNYLHPLEDGHLLAIGRDNGGLQIQIFDVTNPETPKQAHKWTAEGYSVAEGEHKAFNYYATHGMLTFPFVSWNETPKSSLEVLRVDAKGGFEHLASLDHTELMRKNCEARLMQDYNFENLKAEYAPEQLASIEQDIRNQCNWSVGEVKRGVFIDNLIYSISDGGVLAHNIEDFMLASSYELPAPQNYYGGGYYGGDGAVAPSRAVMPPAVTPPVAVMGGVAVSEPAQAPEETPPATDDSMTADAGAAEPAMQ